MLSFFLLFTFSACTGGSEERESQTEDQAQEERQVVDEEGFREAFLAFHAPYKKVLFATGQGKEESSRELIGQTRTAWQGIAAYKDAQPATYAETEAWRGKLQNIENTLRTAERKIEEGDLAAAHELLEDVRADFRLLRQENDIVYLTDLLLAFHDAMEEAIEGDVAAREGQTEKLQKTLVPLLTWTERTEDDNAYQDLIHELEAIASSLPELDDEAYRVEVVKLKPIFINLYLGFE